MNWLTDLYWNIRIKIEDKIYQWQTDRELAKLEKDDVPFVGEYNDEELDQANGISGSWQDEEIEKKPKKKKSKKKSVKKTKKSI